ncbi:hypothetical protein C8J57DRAFT_1494875 [Mycena rebaudengoi]|nr:hypothetical protein C8J57DRAFT_1494875 [Mycena rebaudengoi]
MKYGHFPGPFIRISPSEVSIADSDALGVVYAHANGALKSSLYDEFVSIESSLFNTRDRAQHARKYPRHVSLKSSC